MILPLGAQRVTCCSPAAFLRYGVLIANSIAQLDQPARRFIERLRLLAERKPYLARSIPRVTIKARSRHASHPNFLHQILCKSHIVAKPERRNIRHNVVSAARTEASEPGRRQRGHEMIAPHTDRKS